jgi:hypothetical protein
MVLPDSTPTVWPDPTLKVRPDLTPTILPDPTLMVRPDTDPTTPSQPKPKPSMTPILTEDYIKNIFAFAFSLGATFFFVTFYYCNTLFFAWQGQKQVTKILQLKGSRV